MPKLLVIADDLSGATDVGVQFAKQGVAAFVVIRSETRRPLAELFTDYEVVLVNIESRHIPPDRARLSVTALVEEARSAGVELFYKKTDSTLRGNVGAELDALLKASGRRTLCFLPAHPALGRTTRNGVQFVHSTPLAQSAYGRDPRNPVLESRVAVLLQQESDVPITPVRQTELEMFSANPPAGTVVFDAEIEDEIVRTAEAIRDAGSLNVLAGPAAFASCLPDLIPFKRANAKAISIPPLLLVVNGSLNEVALRQLAVAERNGFSVALMPPEALLSNSADGDEARTIIKNEACARLARGHCVALGSVKQSLEIGAFNEAGRRIVPDINSWPDRIALNTGRIAADILSERLSGNAGRLNFTLAVIGGDTLAGVARANGWQGFVPRCEILPGVAVCEVAEQPGLALITKPGGFGDDETLVKVRAALVSDAAQK